MSLLQLPADHPHRGESLGIYLHVPFCSRICTYCDFFKMQERPETHAAYVAALIREIEALGRGLANEVPMAMADSIYIGGGTPTCLGSGRLAEIVGALHASFSVAADCETTVECNPEDAAGELLSGLLACGVNRLSIGVQSLDGSELEMLGRGHGPETASEAVRKAREAGFDNVSVDAIVGLPRQTEDGAAATIEGIVALRPDHVSAYLLELDKETPIKRSIAVGSLPAPDDEVSGAIYRRVRQTLRSAGLPGYEVSSFAAPSRRSRHNVRYWTDASYLGIGPSAASYWGRRRWTRRANLAGFLAGAGRLDLEGYAVEERSAEGVLRDAVMLGLRLDEGIALERLLARHGGSASVRRDVEELGREGLLVREGDQWRIPEELFPVANFVFERLVSG